MRLATITPAYCSACFAQKPEEQYVDLEASWDGPVLGNGESVPFVSIDDLVLCVGCLTEAAAIVGLGDLEKVRAELEQARSEKRELSERLAGAIDHVGRLEKAAESRGSLEAALRPVPAAAPGRGVKRQRAAA